MKKSRFTEEQIIAVLHEGTGGIPIRDVCRKHGITEQTFYRWTPVSCSRRQRS
jgi:putative transposase